MFAPATRPAGRARLAALATTAALGLGAALLGTTSPAFAATTPTLTGPATTTGYGQVTLTGTAEAGARVILIEAAYIFRGDMSPATEYSNGDIIATTADSSGRFTLRRTMDSGFVFAAEADGVRSSTITIDMIAKPIVRLTTSGTTVNVSVSSDPAQPWLPVTVQRQSGSTWAAVAQGSTAENGVYTTVLTGQSAGTQHYRAGVGPDTENGVRTGYSASTAVVIGGSGTPGTPPPATTPAGPKAGDVRFSLVRYNAPGTDKATNAAYNQEYVRITNYTSKTINLKSWTVKDRAGNTYRFSQDFLLRGKKYVYVLTGKGTDGKPAAYRYWGKKGYIWNNSGDAAYLRTGGNKLIDSCTWGKGSGATSC